MQIQREMSGGDVRYPLGIERLVEGSSEVTEVSREVQQDKGKRQKTSAEQETGTPERERQMFLGEKHSWMIKSQLLGTQTFFLSPSSPLLQSLCLVEVEAPGGREVSTFPLT